MGTTLHFLGSSAKTHQVPHAFCCEHSRCCSDSLGGSEKCLNPATTLFSQEGKELNSYLFFLVKEKWGRPPRNHGVSPGLKRPR